MSLGCRAARRSLTSCGSGPPAPAHTMLGLLGGLAGAVVSVAAGQRIAGRPTLDAAGNLSPGPMQAAMHLCELLKTHGRWRILAILVHLLAWAIIQRISRAGSCQKRPSKGCSCCLVTAACWLQDQSSLAPGIRAASPPFKARLQLLPLQRHSLAHRPTRWQPRLDRDWQMSAGRLRVCCCSS